MCASRATSSRSTSKGIPHKAFRSGALLDTKPVEETRKYVAIGTSADDACERVRSRVAPLLSTMFESLSSTWGCDGDRGDIVELAKVNVETHPGTNIPKG